MGHTHEAPSRADEHEPQAPREPVPAGTAPDLVQRVLNLSRTAGNRAVGRLLQRDPITPPLAKGSTSDWPSAAPKVPLPPTQTVFEDPAASADAAGARKALDEYKKMAPGNRKAAFTFSYPTGAVARVLKALGAESAAGAYADTVRELLRWAEEQETRLASGKTDDEMAEIEAKWVYAKHKKEAEAAKGGKPVTDAEIEQSRETEEKSKSFHQPMQKTRWEKLSAAKKAEWTKKGNEAIAAMVTYAAAKHPELKLKASNFRLAFHEIDKNAPGALGQGGGPGVAEVGFEFVEITKVDPAYAMSTVVHELFGHPEFDDPVNYQQALFAKAGPKIPGYTPDPTAESTSYGYHESEIYSLLRELPYWTKVSAKHDPKWASMNYDPRDGITTQLSEIKDEWEPKLAVALVRGLYKRVSIDPRIAKVAVTAFEGVIKKVFNAADATAILK